MRIRVARPDELDEILDLHAECLPNDEPPDERTLWQVAVDDGVIVGAVGFFPSTHAIGYAYVNRVMVTEGCRHMGIARKLLRAAAQRARRHGYIGLVSDTTGAEMANAFIRSGWRVSAMRWAFPESMHFWRSL